MYGFRSGDYLCGAIIMSNQKNWLLPSGIEEDLPDQALHIEDLRGKVLNLFRVWGYNLVIPPMLEYLESLLVVDDENLNLRTLKLTDQLNGRMMGLRADMTPQVARIDAHRFAKEYSNRLCYIGTVIHARPIDISGVREMVQFGAEIYGHVETDSDIEVICLMLEVIRTIGIDNMQLGLGHVGIYSALIQDAGLDAQTKSALFPLIQMKATHEAEVYLSEKKIATKHIDRLVQLVDLHGGVEVLEQARKMFSGNKVEKALQELITVSERLDALGIVDQLHYDLADLGGYRYDSGIIFAAFVKETGKEIARGGRYDDIGKAFGRDRPATGFSSDLKLLSTLLDNKVERYGGIFAPKSDDTVLHREVVELRRKGHRVVQQLNTDEGPGYFGCDKILVLKENEWQIERL